VANDIEFSTSHGIFLSSDSSNLFFSFFSFSFSESVQWRVKRSNARTQTKQQTNKTNEQNADADKSGVTRCLSARTSLVSCSFVSFSHFPKKRDEKNIRFLVRASKSSSAVEPSSVGEDDRKALYDGSSSAKTPKHHKNNHQNITKTITKTSQKQSRASLYFR